MSPARLEAVLEHSSPGRLRVRVLKSHRSERALGDVRKRLADHPAVAEVTVNPRSGSVLLNGSSTAEMEMALRGVLELVARNADAQASVEEAIVRVVKRADQRLG